MGEKGYSIIFLLVCSAFMFAGVQFGMDCLNYIIPAVAIIIVCVLIYQKIKGRFEMRFFGEAFWTFVFLSIVIFVAVFFGNCIGGITKSGGDTRQQRIEMGLPMY